MSIPRRADIRNTADRIGMEARRYVVTAEDRGDSLMEVVTQIRQSRYPNCITVWQDRRTGIYHARPLSHEAEKEAEKHDWRYLGTGTDLLDEKLLN